MRKYFIKTMLPLAALITCIFGVMYLIFQQNYRMSANDPQIQIAEDTANELNHNRGVSLSPTVYLPDSIAPFLIIFGKDGRPVSSSAKLNGMNPNLPLGVFTYLNSHLEARFTWQPSLNVRLAAVVLKYSNGYILAGRSLREVEIREMNLFYQVFAGWIATLFVTAVSVLLMSLSFPNKKK